MNVYTSGHIAHPIIETGRQRIRQRSSPSCDWGALASYPIPCIVATVEVGNIASQKVVESCGYSSSMS